MENKNKLPWVLDKNEIPWVTDNKPFKEELIQLVGAYLSNKYGTQHINQEEFLSELRQFKIKFYRLCMMADGMNRGVKW